METLIQAAVSVRGLTRRYGAVEAVHPIDFEVRAGEIFGFIGPDGAGKTSTFHMVSGVMEPTEGEVLVFGRPTREVRDQIGYLTQTYSLYPDLTVWENITYVGDMGRLTTTQIHERGLHYLSEFDMEAFTGRLAGQLSGGMKQKLALACALVTEPRLLLLDEPTCGVDPVSRREFWDTLALLSRSGVTMMIATPYLDEAERCHRVALMYEGRIHAVGPPAQLRERLGQVRLEIRGTQLRTAEATLRAQWDVQRFGDRLDVMVADPVDAARRIREQLPDVTLRTAAPTLENVFVSTLRSLGTGGPTVDPLPPARDHGRGGIRAEGLGRRFGDFVAVRDVSLDVAPGTIYGLLGANGAGKTTVIKMLCGLLAPSEGTVRLAGASGSEARTSTVRRELGYMSQKFSLYPDLTVDENLDFFAGVYGMDGAERTHAVHQVLGFANLEGRGHMATGALPGGWKQRIAFGAAVMHDPSVVFLDEPTSGVDPIARRTFWEVINRLADRGVAVLVTTHYLEEAEQCNELGLMVGGELVAQGTPGTLKASQPGHVLSLATATPQAVVELLRSKPVRGRVTLFGDRVHVGVENAVEEAGILALLRGAGVRIDSVESQEFSLEDVFIAVVEQHRP